jgi:hypothetical protein
VDGKPLDGAITVGDAGVFGKPGAKLGNAFGEEGDWLTGPGGADGFVFIGLLVADGESPKGTVTVGNGGECGLLGAESGPALGRVGDALTGLGTDGFDCIGLPGADGNPEDGAVTVGDPATIGGAENGAAFGKEGDWWTCGTVGDSPDWARAGGDSGAFALGAEGGAAFGFCTRIGGDPGTIALLGSDGLPDARLGSLSGTAARAGALVTGAIGTSLDDG